MRTLHFDTRISHFDMRILSVLTLQLYQLFCTWCWDIREICDRLWDSHIMLRNLELWHIWSWNQFICRRQTESKQINMRYTSDNLLETAYFTFNFISAFISNDNMNYWNDWVFSTKSFVLYDEIEFWSKMKNEDRIIFENDFDDFFEKEEYAYRNERCAYRNEKCAYW